MTYWITRIFPCLCGTLPRKQGFFCFMAKKKPPGIIPVRSLDYYLKSELFHLPCILNLRFEAVDIGIIDHAVLTADPVLRLLKNIGSGRVLFTEPESGHHAVLFLAAEFDFLPSFPSDKLYSHSFSRLSFVLYYLYFEPFFYCFGVDFPCHILFIFSRVAKYVAIIAFE